MTALANLEERFPGRARSWRLRTHTLTFGRRPKLMGIINVTPDSFSDGGQFSAPQAAVSHGLKLAEQGADILDIGGESTRPYSTAVSQDEELRRVIPVVEGLCAQTNIPVSIDTSKPEVARQAIALGAEIINDVTGFANPQLVEVAVQSSAGVCAMHMQGTPQTMQDDPAYCDVVADILSYLGSCRDSLVEAGIQTECICLDPGIGFGKTHQHNLTLLANCWRFHELGCPVLVGHSRKGFISKLLGDKTTDRTAASVGVAVSLARQGMQVLRVHDVKAVREALVLFEATGGIDGIEGRIDDEG